MPAMATSRIELMQGMPVFGALRDDTLRYLVERSATVEAAAGEYYFREGEAGDAMYVLEQGHVSVLKAWKGNLLKVNELAEGDCFGEMALMDLGPRSASVRAITRCSALQITATMLLGLFERDAEQFALIQMNLGREVARRLRHTDDLLFQGWAGEKPPDMRALPRRT